jgi:hypothetical protein
MSPFTEHRINPVHLPLSAVVVDELPLTPHSGLCSSANFCGFYQGALTTACSSGVPFGCLSSASCPTVSADCDVPDACEQALDAYQGCLYDVCRSSCQ